MSDIASLAKSRCVRPKGGKQQWSEPASSHRVQPVFPRWQNPPTPVAPVLDSWGIFGNLPSIFPFLARKTARWQFYASLNYLGPRSTFHAPSNGCHAPAVQVPRIAITTLEKRENMCTHAVQSWVGVASKLRVPKYELNKH